MNDPQIISAAIESVGTIAAALVAAVAAGIIGKRFLKQEKLKENLNTAKKDIEFLLEVENKHCEKHKTNQRNSYKNTVRNEVRKDGLEWSGKFTRGRMKNP